MSLYFSARLLLRPCVLLAVLVTPGFYGVATAQNLNFQHYGIRDGLPQTQVRAIHQDTTGFLWVGTYGGLGRYDGRHFTVFSTDDGLNSNNISAITSTADGTVWAGTTSGVCYLSTGDTMFHCLQDPLAGTHVEALLPSTSGGVWAGTEEGLFHIAADYAIRRIDWPTDALPEVTSLAGAPGDAIWIGTRAGLFRLDDGKVVEAPRLPKAAGGQIRTLLQDGAGLWIGTVGGLYLLENGTIVKAPGLPETWIQDDVYALANGHDGSLWAATDHGLLWRKGTEFELVTTRDGLMSDINFALLVDREGVVWVGNDDGLSKYVPGPFVGYTEAHGLLHYFVRTINEDSLGRLWLGTRAGAQIVPYHHGDWHIDESKTITAADGLSDERIYSIAFPAPHEAYLATGNGLVHWREGTGIVRTLTRADGLPANATQALKLQNDRLWIGTNLGVRVLQADKILSPTDPALADAYVYRIRQDTQGRLWFGSQDQGVFMREPDGTTHRFGTAQGLTDETVWDIAPDATGGVWVGSNGDGLFHITANGNVERYTTTDGLIDNFVWQVLVDDTGAVWAYTNRGISRFDGDHFQSYGEDDGLLHLEGGATGVLQSHDGQLWFASANGLMRYDPTREYHNDVPPVIVIQEATLGDKPILEGAELPHQGEGLNFQYAALSFQSEDQLRYKYRLFGADERWSEPVPYRPITYANLGAGNYVFEVKARNPDGVWSTEPAQFNFRVLPAYWATTWFWVLVLAGVALLLWGAYRLRIRQLESRRRDLEDVIAKRTEELANRTDELEAANEQLKAASLVDPLTGLHNRRFLVGQINIDVAQSRRAYHAPSAFPNRDIVFMMIDIDNFKEVNDTHGHIVGDKVLRQYAHLLRNEIRESDYVVRWGGEEFLIVARQTESTQSQVIAQRILDTARRTQFSIDDNGKTVACTCSIGLSYFPFLPNAPDAFTWEQIVDVADMAVYMAKANGRNGWVAIHGTENIDIQDGAAGVRGFRDDIKKHIDSGELIVRSSFGENLEITLVDRQNGRRAIRS